MHVESWREIMKIGKNDADRYDFEFFLECLASAGEKMLDPHYFRLSSAGTEKPVLRERVYCYELYHSLRLALGDCYWHKLDGELDKKGHRIIEPKVGAKKPDFVVHVPGRMDRNLVVMEVKPLDTTTNELEDDLDKLKKFLDLGDYYAAIMLIYGDGKNKLPSRIVNRFHREAQNYADRMLLMWHPGPGETPLSIDQRHVKSPLGGDVSDS